jgi:very-short-patch-repair endonuclease
MKEWIKTNLFTKTNSFNNRTCLESWWITRNYTKELHIIQTLTKDLPENASMTERAYFIYNHLKSAPACHCGNHTTFLDFKSGYRKYCSLQCSYQCKERNEKISKNRDMDSILKKCKSTNKMRYGVDHAFQLDSVKEKIKKTKLERYGDETYNNPEKNKNTCMEKYGVPYACMVESVKEKMQHKKTESLPELRDVNWITKENEDKNIAKIAKNLGVAYRTVYLWVKKHKIDFKTHITTKSGVEKEIAEFVKSLGVSVIENDRKTIAPKELDIYIPEHNLAIELNGIYWHAENKTRHLEKHTLCAEKNIKLLQIWDNEWNEKRDIVISIIKSNLKINRTLYARKCKIGELCSKQFSDFLKYNHIQGNANASIRYGLFNGEELVAVMGFSKSRFGKKQSHELIRFANKIDLNVVGGFSKLFKHAIKEESIVSIQTFCDLRIFSGHSYASVGFKYSHTTTPGYFYYKSGKILNRQSAQKHKLGRLLPLFDNTLSEAKNMQNAGWIKVWDCGQKVFTYEKASTVETREI